MHMSLLFIDGWVHPTMGGVSPASDYYDSFNSSCSRSVKQEPCTPNFGPEDVINNLMFVDETSNQMKTEYNAGNNYSKNYHINY